MCAGLADGLARGDRLLLLRGSAVLLDRQCGCVHTIIRPAPIPTHPAAHRGCGLRDSNADVAVERIARWHFGVRHRDHLSSHPGAYSTITTELVHERSDRCTPSTRRCLGARPASTERANSPICSSSTSPALSPAR